MRTREELGPVLLDCLKDVAALLERAHAAAVEQQAALVKSDAAALVRVCRAQEELLRRIAECDQRAADAATDLAAAAGLDPDAIDMRSIAGAAGPECSGRIAYQLTTISDLAEKVREANEINSKLLSNGLEIVACCLRTLATDQGQGAYSSGAEIREGTPCILSLDRKA